MEKNYVLPLRPEMAATTLLANVECGFWKLKCGSQTDYYEGKDKPDFLKSHPSSNNRPDQNMLLYNTSERFKLKYKTDSYAQNL